MTLTTHRCACGQPAPDATICPACTAALARDLAAVPWLLGQLDLALSRQTASGGSRDGGRSSDKPLPYDVGASDALDMLAKVRRRWEPLDADRIRQLPDADKAVVDVHGAVAKARRTIDRRPDRWFAGPCDGNGWTMRPQGVPEHGCGDWLYARPEARDVTCPTCKTAYDVATRRAWMLEAAEDYLCHAELIAAAVTRLGEPVKPGRIRLWKHRGRLEQRGVDEKRRPLYRVGDVLDLVHGESVRRTGVSSSNDG